MSTKRGDPWFAKITTGFAMAASGLLALFGWHTLTGWIDLETGVLGGPERVGAFVALVLVTIAAEFAGSRALIYWRQNQTGDGQGTAESRGALFLGAACSLFIVASGFFGAHSISERMTAPARLQSETAYRVAQAETASAAAMLERFETRAAAEVAPARLAVAMATGSGRRAAGAERDRIEKAHGVERARLEAAKAAADAKLAAADVGRTLRPEGLPVWLKVGLSVLLELLKAGLLWVATPRASREVSPFAGLDRDAIRAMPEAERESLASTAATIASWCRHAKGAVKSAA